MTFVKKRCPLRDDVITRKIFPRYWPFVRGIHRSPVNSPHKGQWRGALMFSLICVWINDWVNNPEAGDFRRYRAHYDVTVMTCTLWISVSISPSTANIRQWIGSVLVQIIACRLFGTKPLFKPLLGLCNREIATFSLKKMRLCNIVCEISSILSRGGWVKG